jgi:hypothetical protein
MQDERDRGGERAAAIRWTFLAAAVLSAAQLGCRDERALAASRGDSPREAAVDRIVSEYCDKQASCAEEREVDFDGEVCTNRMKTAVRAEIREESCPKGVSEGELSRCIQGVRVGECGNPLDTPSQLDSCSARRICR